MTDATREILFQLFFTPTGLAASAITGAALWLIAWPAFVVAVPVAVGVDKFNAWRNR